MLLPATSTPDARRLHSTSLLAWATFERERYDRSGQGVSLDATTTRDSKPFVEPPNSNFSSLRFVCHVRVSSQATPDFDARRMEGINRQGEGGREGGPHVKG